MSELIKPYLDKIKSIEGNLEGIARKIVIENGDFIIEVLKELQLGEGIGSDGNIVGRYKKITDEWASSPWNKKPRKSKIAGDPFNFEWTGKFFDGMKLAAYSDGFNIFSIDGKQRLLEQQYGELTKLTDKNNEMINNDIILPELQKYILENVFMV